MKPWLGLFNSSSNGRTPETGDTRRKFDPDSIVDGFEDDESALATVKHIWTSGRTKMYPRLQQWLTNLLFFRGDQWPQFHLDELYGYSIDDGANGSEIPDPRMVANLTQRHLLAFVARTTKNNPRTKTFPVTNDEDDKDRAAIYNKLIQWRSRKMGLSSRMVEITTISALYGSCFLKSEFDSEAGPHIHPLSDMQEGDMELMRDPIMQENVPELARASKIADRGLKMSDLEPEGDVKATIIAPYHITFPDPHLTRFGDATGVLESRMVTLQSIKEEFYSHPGIDELRMSDSGWGEQLWFFQRLGADIENRLSGSSGNLNDEISENDAFSQVLRHEYWGKETRKRPLGIHVVIAGDLVLKNGPNPYWHGLLPYSQVIHTIDPVSVWGTCDLEQAIPVQQQINETLNLIIKSREQAGNPRILDNGSRIPWKSTANTPGEVLMNPSPSRRPEFMELPSLPAYIGGFLNDLRGVLEEIFSNQQPSRGISKSGDSGVKVRALQQADEQQFAPFARNMADALDQFWIQQLCLITQYTDKEKVGYVVGRQNERSYFSYDRESLLGGELQPEFRLFSEKDRDRARVLAMRERLDLVTSVNPGKSSATVREEIGMLMQTGYLQPGVHTQLVLEMLGYEFEIEDIMAEDRQQASMASIENDALEAGQAPAVPAVHEDHARHLEVHKRFSTSRKFRAMPEQLQDLGLKHIEAHEKAAIMEPIRLMYLKQQVVGEMAAQYGMLAPLPAEGGNGQAGGPQRSKPSPDKSQERRPVPAGGPV